MVFLDSAALVAGGDQSDDELVQIIDVELVQAALHQLRGDLRDSVEGRAVDVLGALDDVDAGSAPRRSRLGQRRLALGLTENAQITTFMFVSGSSVARGFVRFLAAGKRLVLNTDPMPDVTKNQTGGFVSCYEDEARRVAQTWFMTNRRRRYRKRLWREVPTDDEMFAGEYPDVPLEGLEPIATHTPMLAQP